MLSDTAQLPSTLLPRVTLGLSVGAEEEEA